MKKFLVIMLTLVTVLAIAGCAGNQDTNPNSITNMSEGEVLKHVEIVNYPVKDGETSDNPYYKREKAEDGDIVYAVMPKDADEPDYIPASDTVVYTRESGECFYEVVKYTYDLNGEQQEMTQYHLYISGQS